MWPPRGGLNFREGNYVCETLFSTGRLRSMDLVEVRTCTSSCVTLSVCVCVLCVCVMCA